MRTRRATAGAGRTEAEEREYWTKRDSTRAIDYERGARGPFSELRPTMRTVSLQLPASLYENLKLVAHREEVELRSLVRLYLAEKVTEALRMRRRKNSAA